MEWPRANHSDINLIENFRSTINRGVFENGKLYPKKNSSDDKTCCKQC